MEQRQSLQKVVLEKLDIYMQKKKNASRQIHYIPSQN